MMAQNKTGNLENSFIRVYKAEFRNILCGQLKRKTILMFPELEFSSMKIPNWRLGMLNMDSDWSKILSTADKSNALNYDKFIEHNQSKGCHRMSKT